MSTPEYAPYFGTSTLKLNTDVVSTYVMNVQIWLEHIYGINLDVDGRFGVMTESFVKLFQNDSNLKVDGQVGRDTKAALWKINDCKPYDNAILA